MVEKVFENKLRYKINEDYRKDEAAVIEHLLEEAKLSLEAQGRVRVLASSLIEVVRVEEKKRSGIDSFMHEYDLSSDEGIALMCLAEAMLRIPDKGTVDKLIREKIGGTDWGERLGKSDSWTINAATWALMLTGKVLSPAKNQNHLSRSLKNFFTRSGEPVIRKSIQHAMRIMGRQFVMGRTMPEALKRAQENEAKGFRYSYDMLGEAARTQADADRYFTAYEKAIQAVGDSAKGKSIDDSPGISVKLSALHPRYEYTQSNRVISELIPRVLRLSQQAKACGIGLTIDAEEADRLDLSLDIIEAVFKDPSLDNWEGFGLALQSYQKRAWSLIDWLAELARSQGRRMKVRLIKGAYWDTEIKLAQMQGLSDYPVFTRKASTDVSFMACAKKLIEHHDVLYPQFATHNAYSAAVVMELMAGKGDYEFQCLHGMGQSLYEEIVVKKKIPCRIYAPVGTHEDLLPYLVRRLLENGANTSFVNRINDAKANVNELIADPVSTIFSLSDKRHPRIPLPQNIYGPARLNAKGTDLSNREVSRQLASLVKSARKGAEIKGSESFRFSPIDGRTALEAVPETPVADLDTILVRAHVGFKKWNGTPHAYRAKVVRTIADVFEAHQQFLLNRLVNEAGKTLPDAISEVREAVDFCRYYADLGEHMLGKGESFQGYTGETNDLRYSGRGVIVCISPWNFPLAIFAGQVVAALMAGNAVLAKPAEQTPDIARYAVSLMYEAGVPKEALQTIYGLGETVGDALIKKNGIDGVLFTGSTETAQIIQRSLANKSGPIVPFVAETGGVNAMIADSSALPEQLVQDVIRSAFGSAGQRCSALRVLFVQEDIADKLLSMLSGALAEVVVGDPVELNTDVGPVIDEQAFSMLQSHIARLTSNAKLIAKTPLPEGLGGYYVPPHVFELASDAPMPPEIFGPVLHVFRYSGNQLKAVMDKINSTGYGLTLGVHSRINETVQTVISNAHAGNVYVNRDMIGAVVGLQPFGGEGLSGTGPKAGGPNYLKRLCVERTVTVNTTAAGGNASLMSLAEI